MYICLFAEAAIDGGKRREESVEWLHLTCDPRGGNGSGLPSMADFEEVFTDLTELHRQTARAMVDVLLGAATLITSHYYIGCERFGGLFATWGG